MTYIIDNQMHKRKINELLCNDSEDKSGEASIDYFVFQPELNNGLDEAIIGKIKTRFWE